jgi:conjugative relaxase-like TrwC/TraI family protein
MLSISKMTAGSEQYYLDTVAAGREEYYTGAGEAPGYWLGAACKDLGLHGEVAPQHLRAVLAAVSPVDGSELLSRKMPAARRVTGFDFTLSAPKSVSLLYGFGSEQVSDAVRACHDEAVAAAVKYLEAHGAYARRGTNGVRRLGTSGLVAAGFRHRTSRAGDPQLHTHVLVANIVHAEDGRWSSLHASPTFHQGRTAGFVYQAVLRAGLTSRLGVSFGPVTKGAAEIEGLPKALLKLFSTRRAEIESRLAELGGSSRRTREIATLETRHAKGLGGALDREGLGGALDREGLGGALDREGLREGWLRRAAEASLDPGAIESVLGTGREPVVTNADLAEMTRVLLGWEGLTEQVSVFERRDVVAAVAERLTEGARLDWIEWISDQVVANEEVVILEGEGRGGEATMTTRDMLRVESQLLSLGDEMLRAGAIVPEEIVDAVLAERPSIAEEQAEMVRLLTTRGGGLKIVVGKAGTGKTYALDAARAAWQRAGFSVQGAALSARAAAELESGSGIYSTTMARFMDYDNLAALRENDVVVVDEAGMVGTRDLHQLMVFASRGRATVVLCGDHRQLPEIQAGGALRALASRFGAIQLSENRRQHEEWERRALDDLRHGSVTDGVVAYEEHGRLHLCDSARSARLAMVAEWAGSRSEGGSSRMYAISRSDVEDLNILARAELRRRGLLVGDIAEAGGRAYAVGDEVLFCRNDRRLGVLNGTRGTVSGGDSNGLVVESDRGTRVVGPDYLEEGHLSHGYASTVHKAQGATVDRAFVLGSDALYREAGYVAMSRASERTDLYIVTPAFDAGLAPAEVSSPGLVSALSVSRAKSLAIESLGPGFDAQAAELGDLKELLASAPPDARSDRRSLEWVKRELSTRDRPSTSYIAEIADRERRVSVMEAESAAFGDAHAGEIERAHELRTAGSIGQRLLGEVAAQGAPAHVVAEIGEVVKLPAARNWWVRLAGAVERSWQKARGSNRGADMSRANDSVDLEAEREELRKLLPPYHPARRDITEHDRSPGISM